MSVSETVLFVRYRGERGTRMPPRTWCPRKNRNVLVCCPVCKGAFEVPSGKIGAGGEIAMLRCCGERGQPHFEAPALLGGWGRE